MIKNNEIPTAEKIQIGNKVHYKDVPENTTVIEEDNQVDFSKFFDDDNSKTVETIEEKEIVKEPRPKKEKEVKKNYKFTSMFWLYNIENKIESNCDVVNISYNSNFGNLRISFFNYPNDRIKNHSEIDKVLFFNNLSHIVSITIYPTDCFKILSDLCKSFQFIEPLYYNGEPWQLERPITHIEKNIKENNLIMGIWTKNEEGYLNPINYNFSNINYEMLKHSCNFAVNGGFISSSNNVN